MTPAALPASVKEAIKGLKFRTSQTQDVPEQPGKKRAVPMERPMTEEDVLSHKIEGTTVVLVSRDGMKHTITRTEKKDEKKDEKK